MSTASLSFSFNLARLLRVAAILVAVGSSGIAAPVDNFYNVIAQDGADPSIIRHTDGWYYYTKTTGGNVRLWRSRTLSGLDGSQSKVIWTPTAGTQYSSNIWAPELVRLDDKWYVYFAADDGDNANHRMYVLENTNADPFVGDWTFRGKIADSTDRWAIDGTAFVVGSRKYFIWSGWPGSQNVQQNLYIAEMSNPWTISSARVLISTPTHSWETNTSPKVNEGPEVIIRNGKINLVYSASGSWTDSYCLGLITANAGSNLLSASSWTKRSTPIFSTANSIWGPGHHTFTTSPDGSENWIVYHNARWQGSGWTRQIRAQKFTWNSDDTPNFGTPVARHAAIKLPSGEIGRQRYEAEDAVLKGIAEVLTGANSSGGRHVGNIDTVESGVTFTVGVPASGTYMLAARTGCGRDDVSSATHRISVNGGSSSNLRIVKSGWGNWGNAYARINLNAGTNTISFSKGDSFAELDAIDLFPIQPPSPPAIAAIMDTTIQENTGTGSIPVILSDTDTPLTNLALSAQSSNPALVPQGGILLGGSGAMRTIKLTPAPHRAGTATITLTVTDGFSSVQRTFLFTVTTTPAGWWRQTWFGNTADDGDARATADPDSDGITNDWERLSGGSPLAADIAAKPTVSLDGEFLQIEYLRSRVATDLQPRVEWSRDLQTWSTDGVQDVLISTEGDIEKRRGRIPLGDAPGGFLRLRLNE